MGSFFDWILKSGLYLFIFWAVYMLVFKRSNSFKINRLYIIFSTLFSIVLATITLSFHFDSENSHIEKVTSSISNYMLQFSEVISDNFATVLPEVVIKNTENLTSENLAGSLSQKIFLSVFIGISAIFICLFLMRLVRIFQIIITNHHERFKNMCLVEMKNESPTFSFFHWLFISQNQRNKVNFDAVYFHENAHFRRIHSLDNIFFELMGFVFWWHPVWHFYRCEIKNLHEYEADSIAVKRTNKIDYQKFLLEITCQGNLIFITNPFNVSLLKKRMIMMNTNKKSSKWNGLLKIAILLPFVIATIFIQACGNKLKNAENLEVKGPFTLVLDEQGVSAVGNIYAENGTELLGENVKINLDDKFIEKLIDTISQLSGNNQKMFAEANYDVTNQSSGDETVFNIVDEMPEFQGGTAKMIEYLSKNIKYPSEAKQKGVQGKVFVQFVVESDGSVSKVQVLRGIGGGCDEEAVRVVESMPKWKPGKQRGKAVRVMFNIPVRFTLN